MPFVQRVVQPTRLAQVITKTATATTTTNGANSTLATNKFQCVPGKCNNNNCINNKAQNREKDELDGEVEIAVQQLSLNDKEELSVFNGRGKVQGKIQCNGRLVLERQSATRVKDAEEQYEAAQQTRIATKAIVHNSEIIVASNSSQTTSSHAISLMNGYGEKNREAEEEATAVINEVEISVTNGCSFSYATDNEDDLCHNLSQQRIVKPQTLSPLKKLKQHVEFLPPTSPTHSIVNKKHQQQQQLQHQRSVSSSASIPSTSKTKPKLVTGYEFESISNITLSNALRQLASLVLLASDIFDDLQSELQSVGERTRAVQQKIVAVEQRVTAYDPKLVAVPQSDLLTFAQRKTHYESTKTVTTELFSAETRPHSVRVLYENAGRVSPTHSQQASACASAGVSPRSPTREGIINGNSDGGELSDTGVTSSEELVCTPVFGKTNRKMRTRIDAEIEIRLPAGIEDLRKWTSTEALGDVTVTPDCMHHVDTSISTSVVIGDNGILTPALSPSVLSADAVDALYSFNSSNLNDLSQIPSDVNKDVPLNHRLPSPEEQCKIIALRYPAEIISVDTSGKRFQRMCLARKSTTGCFNNANGSGNNANGVENEESPGSNNLNEDVQTVSRRSRSRKSRGKRRNTIAGIDQKEIQIAAEANGAENINNAQQTTPATEDSQDSALRRNSEKASAKKFARSKSSDILKKESVALPYDKGKNTLTRLNSLKQWGRNRFKFMQRHDNNMLNWSTGKEYGADGDMLNNMVDQKINEQQLNISSVGNKPDEMNKVVIKEAAAEAAMEEECNNLESKNEGRFSHERKPSYSSSEKSVSVSSTGQLKGKLSLAACANVKLRDTSTLNRQRRQGVGITGLVGKDEQPHSSSGNWSASSESGRASIGSEITIQPKSSASNTSLNCSSLHAGSGPPSSMLSRRRFLNTSASSSVTSEGTATPELQGDHYPLSHLDDETSSAYSCDTEGYYTSFHMDSGLRTLKEEEPLQNGQSVQNYSMSSQSNQTVMSAENEYELFGRGSTSTTTSSAGTVCTTLMGNVSAEQSSISSSSLGPDVPERISSLGKLNKSRESTLERSYSSSTMSSTLERTGTIKRNVNAGLSMSSKSAEVHSQQNLDTPESQESEFNFDHRMKSRSAQPLPNFTHVEVECSESSDLEGVERIERMRQKTTINAKRIPSMCIITPTTSDDDEMIAQNQSQSDKDSKDAYDPERTLTPESSPTLSQRTLNLDTEELLGTKESPQASPRIVEATKSSPNKLKSESLQPKDYNLNNIKRHSQNGFNHMIEKLKVVLPNLKSSPQKSSVSPVKATPALNDDDLYDLAGEYVTIADVGNTMNNNNNKYQSSQVGGRGIYYANDIIKKKLLVDESSEYAQINESSPRKVEYVSLNELPPLRAENIPKLKSSPEGANSALNRRDKTAAVPMYAEISELNNGEQNNMLDTQPRVRLNAQGKIIYDSDSLKRRKTAHTTFAPGPCVKESESALPVVKSESATNVIEQNVAIPGKTVATPAKLFLLNGGVAATRKIANVRPIVSQANRLQNNANKSNNNNINNINNNNMYLNPFVAYQEQKKLLINQTNPFYQEPLPSPPPPPTMLPSPSAKSTISGSSGSSSSRSSNSLESASQSRDSAYQHFSRVEDQMEPLKSELISTKDVNSPFQRNSSIYWTLQNRRPSKASVPAQNNCRDDLYATPIRRSERLAKANVNIANNATGTHDIVPRLRNSFHTSTPTRSQESSPHRDSPECLNTCADRIGQSKTSLMDFKKLLLAKSTKGSPVQRKVSAVELLKKNTTALSSTNTVTSADNLPGTDKSVSALNSSMKLLDLSSSPKTFANRRMLRQGQFGSPSKNLAPKIKSHSPVSQARQRTEIISTTIPEVNSEEDQSSGGSSSTCSSNSDNNSLKLSEIDLSVEAAIKQQEAFDMKRNFFLQNEENNFMRNESKNAFRKSPNVIPKFGNAPNKSEADANKNKSLPALETAL